MTDNPYSTPSAGSMPPPVVGDASWAAVIHPLREVAGWSKFLGIMLIVIGAIYCLTIIGIIDQWSADQDEA